LVAVAGFFALRWRKPAVIEQVTEFPTRITPLSVITTLRRIDWERGAALTLDQRASLNNEIGLLEQTYFGRSDAGEVSLNGEATAQLRGALERWVKTQTTTSV